MFEHFIMAQTLFLALTKLFSEEVSPNSALEGNKPFDWFESPTN
jgi:hypothetical protein